MANFYSGQDGQLFINDAQAAKVSNWSFSATQAVLDTVSLGDTDRTLIAGLRTASGSCTLYYYQETVGGHTDTATLINEIVKGAPGTEGGRSQTADNQQVKFKLKIDDGSISGRYIEFYAWITNFSMNNSVGSVLSSNVSFEVNGAVTGLSI